jgi:hypothetical protein
MEEVLYAGSITVGDFPRLIADCGFSSTAFALIARLPERVITRARERHDLVRFTYFDRSIPFTDYTSGRIFDEQAELRWEKQGNSMQVVYLGSKGREQILLNYGLRESHELVKLNPTGEKKIFLFGERIAPEDAEKMGGTASPGDFAEVRIPRLLHYPVSQDKQRYVRLVVREYCDEQNRVVLFRFQDLKQWSE